MIDQDFAPSRGTQRRRMRWPTAIIFAAALVYGLAPAAWADNALTLPEALERTLEHNPELRVFDWREEVLAGRRQLADRAPGFALGVEAENLLGTGDFSGLDELELAVSLSSVIELGDKRRNRTRVVDSRLEQLDAEEQARALDVLGEVTQRFISTLALQEKLTIELDAVALAETNLALVTERVDRGAAPSAERLRAEAALARSRLGVAAIRAEHAGRLAEISAFWGEPRPAFGRLAGDLYRSAPVGDFEALDRRIESTPAIERFASTARVRDAELALAQSRSSADIRWHVGARHHRARGDTALTAGFSIPLFAGSRNRGNLASARAAREMVTAEERSAVTRLRARVHGAWQAHAQAREAVDTLQSEVIPALTEALEQTRLAYERGRYSYLDWTAAQRELLEARRALADAAAEALLNQALIERLTAQSLAEGRERVQP
ncbi:MAG: TolC family protein [Xanthomonadales bacterium]|nr:TolC family protein [Xanthomonadales bacterium]